MIDILKICAGVLLARIVTEVFNEGYRFKWQRIRLELRRLFSRRQRHKKKIQVSHESEEATKRDLSFIPDSGGSKTTRKHTFSPQGCAFPRFFNPPN